MNESPRDPIENDYKKPDLGSLLLKGARAVNRKETTKEAGSDRQVQKDKDGNFYVIEQVELSETASDVDVPDDFADISDVDDMKASEADLNDLDKLIEATRPGSQLESKKTGLFEKRPETKAIQRETVIDDFIRNFLVKHQMKRTLEAFQQEWYELCHKGKFSANDLGNVPDVYIKNEKLEEKIEALTAELNIAKITAEKAKATWDKLRKERDFHKMHHSRVQQEKTKLNHDIEKLKGLHKEYEEKYQDLSNKYEAAMKEKMLLKLERDRLLAKSESLQKTVDNLEDKIAKEVIGDRSHDKGNEISKELKPKPKTATGLNTKGKWTSFPPEDRINPWLNATIESYNPKGVNLNKAFRKAHMMAVSSIAMHPKKSIIATGSDDMTWKIWTIPNGELIMSGEGHKDWISGIDFHPKGTHLATCSGDSTIKVWDFVHASCVHTFKDHIQPVWSVAFNDTGDFLVSTSMDHSCKLFDLGVGKHRSTFRGHVDSVNKASFIPYTNLFATASADKTVSLWDMRTGLCSQTFYGHMNAVSHVSTSLRGDLLASCDADGVVKVWDTRMVKEKNQLDTGNYSANGVAFDKSGSVLAVACDDGFVKVFTEATGKQEANLKGHEDAVQDVVFDYNSRMIVSVGSDASFIVWQ